MSQKYVTFIAKRCLKHKHTDMVGSTKFCIKRVCALLHVTYGIYTYLQLCLQFTRSGSLDLCLQNGKCITVK